MTNGFAVIVSSTSKDLIEYRQAAINSIIRVKMISLIMETLPASDADAISDSLDLVDQADIYVGIFAYRYGYRPNDARNPDDLSVTELEYRYALKRGIPILCFIMSDKNPVLPEHVEMDAVGQGKLKALKDEMMTKRVINFFDSPKDLELKIYHALVEKKKSLVANPSPTNVKAQDDQSAGTGSKPASATQPSETGCFPLFRRFIATKLGRVISGLIVIVTLLFTFIQIMPTTCSYWSMFCPMLSPTSAPPTPATTETLTPPPSVASSTSCPDSLCNIVPLPMTVMPSATLTTPLTPLPTGAVETPTLTFSPTLPPATPFSTETVMINSACGDVPEGMVCVAPPDIQAFAMDVTEVTRTDFFPFVEDPQNIRDSIARARLLQVAGSTGNSSGELPMTSVGHDEAQLYCESRGEGYRLPTEEQWHAAAYWNPQTGLLQRYPWGEALPAIGNFAGTLRAVALFTPNASGLHDMAGNAAEWVLGADRSDYRTLGGDYVSEPEETQFDTPDRRYNEATPLTGLERIGFRCVWQP